MPIHLRAVHLYDEPSHLMSQDGIHVAYADDHVAVRKGIINLLKDLGGVVVDFEADDGNELIEGLKKAKRPPDVCILDVSMPNMDGFQAIVEVKKRWPDMKVLVITMHETEFYIIRMIRNGANGYLLKSCAPDDIKAALIAIHTKGVYHSTAAPSKFTDAIKHNIIKLPALTEMEIKFLKLCGSDLTYVEIAEKLKTTTKAVEGYRDKLFKKLNVNSRVSLALYAVQFGLVPLEYIGVQSQSSF